MLGIAGRRAPNLEVTGFAFNLDTTSSTSHLHEHCKSSNELTLRRRLTDHSTINININATMSILIDILSIGRCTDKICANLPIRDVLSLRALNNNYRIILDASNPYQERLFFRAVLPQLPQQLPVTLELNPLLFARPYRWFRRNGFSFYKHPNGGFYELHIETSLNQEALLNHITWRGKQAVLTRPSQTTLTVDMRAYRMAPPMSAQPRIDTMTWIAGRLTISNANGITYGDLLVEAVRLGRRNGGSPGDKVIMEVRFLVGHNLRLGRYTEVLGQLSEQQRRGLGV